MSTETTTTTQTDVATVSITKPTSNTLYIGWYVIVIIGALVAIGLLCAVNDESYGWVIWPIIFLAIVVLYGLWQLINRIKNKKKVVVTK